MFLYFVMQSLYHIKIVALSRPATQQGHLQVPVLASGLCLRCEWNSTAFLEQKFLCFNFADHYFSSLFNSVFIGSSENTVLKECRYFLFSALFKLPEDSYHFQCISLLQFKQIIPFVQSFPLDNIFRSHHSLVCHYNLSNWYIFQHSCNIQILASNLCLAFALYLSDFFYTYL